MEEWQAPPGTRVGGQGATHVQGSRRVAKALRNGLDHAARVAWLHQEKGQGRLSAAAAAASVAALPAGAAKGSAVHLLQIHCRAKAPEGVHANGLHTGLACVRSRRPSLEASECAAPRNGQGRQKRPARAAQSSKCLRADYGGWRRQPVARQAGATRKFSYYEARLHKPHNV